MPVRKPWERFAASHAVVIGIDQYTGVPTLRNAKCDAEAVGDELALRQHFTVTRIHNADATLERLRTLLEHDLPELVRASDRLLLYFAGHGVAASSTDRAAGYLVPVGATRDVVDSYLDMAEVYDALGRLPCKHVLVVLDCCFAGTFRWPRRRDVEPVVRVYAQTYDRYVASPAWQALTSAARDQRALDQFEGGGREELNLHSPFAQALLTGLRGSADPNGDGLISATELYLYVRDEVERLTQTRFELQTPGLFPMERHESGEFVFEVPDRELLLPPLTLTGNPYRGLAVYNADDRHLFFGREAEEQGLVTAIGERAQTLVVGQAGTGKSSLVAARIVPALAATWRIVEPRRAGQIAHEGFGKIPEPDGRPVLLVVDQLEELVTQDRGGDDVAAFLVALATAKAAAGDGVHVLATVRSDFEPLLAERLKLEAWNESRFFIAPMTQDQLRRVIQEPARAREIYFTPPAIVEQLINEVVQMPGALPLLSHTMAMLYVRCFARQADPGFRREITAADYQGGVATAVTSAADELLGLLVAADARYERTIRNVMLRLVSHEGGSPARRRISRDALIYDGDEGVRVRAVLARFETERLVIPADGQVAIELAHDVLAIAWPRLRAWSQEITQLEPTLRALEVDARRTPSGAWSGDPRLSLVVPLAAEAQGRLTAAEVVFVNDSERARLEALRRARVRRRWFTIGAATAAVGFAIIAGVAWLAKRRADTETVRATANEHRATDQASVAEAQRANQILAAPGGWLDGLPVAMRAASSASAETRQVLDGVLARAVFDAVPVMELDDPRGSTIAFSPDEKVLAAGDSAGTLRLWDVATGALVDQFTSTDNLRWVAVTDDGRAVASVGKDGASVWTRPLGKRCTIPCGAELLSVQLSHDQKMMLTTCSDHTHELRAIPSCDLIGTFARNRSPRTADGSLVTLYAANAPIPASLSPDDQRLAIPGLSSGFDLVDVKTQRQTHVANPAYQEPYTSVVYARRASRLLAERADTRFDIWDLATQPKLLRVQYGDSAALPPDGSALACDNSGAVQLLQLDRAGQETLDGSGLTWPQFSDDGNLLTALGRDGLVRVWDALIAQSLLALRGRTPIIDAVATSSSGRFVATTGEDRTLRIWDLASRLPSYPEIIKTVAISQRVVAVNGDSGNVWLWDLATLAVHELDTGVLAKSDVHFSTDGSLLVAVSAVEVDVIDTATRRVLVHLTRSDDDPVYSAALSNDNTRLAVAGFNQAPQLWDVRANQLIANGESKDKFLDVGFVDNHTAVLSRHESPSRLATWDPVTNKLDDLFKPRTKHDELETMAISPTGTIAIVHRIGDGADPTQQERFVTMWSRTRTPVEVSLGTSRSAGIDTSLAFSRDGSRVAIWLLDPTAEVVDVATGKVLATVHTGGATVTSASLTDDGRRLLTTDSGDTAQIWDVATATPLAILDDVTHATLAGDGSFIIAARGRTLRRLALDHDSLFAAGCRLLSGLRTMPQLSDAERAELVRACLRASRPE